ncbi:MAG: hypothetical protein NTY38_09895 [Acidobacteria bacterium]|nr:hypothetical protein [Acidobacteriota bacterium]
MMDARDFLIVAGQFSASPREAERRTSIGRSYYALFNLILGALAAKGVPFHESADDHRDLIAYLAKVRHGAAGRIGQVLSDLRTQRNIADYRMKAAVPEKTSGLVFEKAKRAIAEFDAIAPADLDEIARKIQAIP